jgi:uncharacterized protein YndB with AHSA1/START domain
MTTSTPPAPAPPPRRRVRKRIWIPLILLGLLLLFLIVLIIRGTWSDTVEKNPSYPWSRAVTQLYRGPNGRTVVRCARVIDAPPQDVWKVVSDYANHPAFLPYLSTLTADPVAEGKVHLEGVAHSRLWGDWPFKADVVQKEAPDKGEYEALWDETNADFTVNRGGWILKPAMKKNTTLVVFTLEIELKKYPSFLVRNILMDRLDKFVWALGDEVKRRQK